MGFAEDPAIWVAALAQATGLRQEGDGAIAVTHESPEECCKEVTPAPNHSSGLWLRELWSITFHQPVDMAAVYHPATAISRLYFKEVAGGPFSIRRLPTSIGVLPSMPFTPLQSHSFLVSSARMPPLVRACRCRCCHGQCCPHAHPYHRQPLT